jgi:hypothetical protein
MKTNLKKQPAPQVVDIERMARAILAIQKDSGEIPWSEGGKTDPWDHVESAMGLTVAGFGDEAANAYLWTARNQMADGSLYAAYKDGRPQERRKDPNMTSYIAVGVYHHFLVEADLAFVKEMWPTVRAALDFTVALQSPEGPICWSVSDDGTVENRALLTGSCSIYLSLRCGLALARLLDRAKPQWELAARKLGKAIRCRRHLFDSSKSRYSMDWYYPVLCGALRGDEARKRITDSWDRFVVEHWGVKCVAERPWVTMAESSELILALAACGMDEQGGQIFSWLKDSCHECGLYWTGCTYPDSVVWPLERTTWTTAAVLLAGDALYGWTRGARVFAHTPDKGLLEQDEDTAPQPKKVSAA